MPFICQLETNEKTMKEKKGVQNMLVDISNKNLDMLENVKQIMVKGKITQSLSLFGVKLCQKREREYPSLLQYSIIMFFEVIIT